MNTRIPCHCGSHTMSTTKMGGDTRSARSDFFQLKNDRFVHTITQEKRSIKPGECRGGILADEMGMV